MSSSCLKDLFCRTLQGEEEAARKKIVVGTAVGWLSQMTQQLIKLLK